MNITGLVENTSNSGMKVQPGLSLYVQTRRHRLLFDLGPDGTLLENAVRLHIDLSQVDTVVISHGHMDHGGGLRRFLGINSKATVYVQRRAFEPHYTKVLFLKVPVSLDRSLMNHPQVKLLDGDYKIDEELQLFTVDRTDALHSPANDALWDAKGRDTFAHEQNLVISEDTVALIMGCGHCGVANILEKGRAYCPRIVVGGFHLQNPVNRRTAPVELLDKIAAQLNAYGDITFYTCHCTGKRAYDYLARQVPNLYYLSCGATVWPGNGEPLRGQ